jgi:surface polysaccharide O-acyltransferase-like enzyme
MLVVAGRWDPVGVVVRLLTGNASYQMYFVIALLQAYLLWSLAMPWLRRRPQATQTAILVGAFALSVAVHILRAWYLEVNHADFLAFSRTTVFPWIGYFALGCLTGFGDIALISPPSRQVSIVSPDSQEAKGNFGDRQRDPMRPGLAVSHVAPAAFAILALMVAYDVSYHGPHQDPPQNTLLKPAYAVVMIWLVGRLGATWAPRMGERSRRFAAALARDSYGIYLSHVLVMGLLSRVVYIQLAGLSLPLELAYRIVALIITVAAAWGLVRLLSLIPGVRYLSGADVRWDSGT